MSNNDNRIDSPSRTVDERPFQRTRNAREQVSSSSSSSSEMNLNRPPTHNGQFNNEHIEGIPGHYNLDIWNPPTPQDYRLIPLLNRIAETTISELMKPETKSNVRYIDVQLLRVIAPDSLASKANLYYNRSGTRGTNNTSSYAEFIKKMYTIRLLISWTDANTIIHYGIAIFSCVIMALYRLEQDVSRAQ